MEAKQKVAILGGGLASIVAAYELTATQDLRDRYDVTVYQFGWRLGGKCASGRNATYGQRIEEHGLHIWFGFYENAFRVMRDAYEKLGRDPKAPLATWRDAFKPCEEIVLYECFDERWKGWSFKPPGNPLTPGDSDYLPEFWEVVHTMLDYLLGRWEHLKVENPNAPDPEEHPPVALPFGLRLPFGLGVPFGIDRLAAQAVERILPWDLPSPERAIFDALGLAERRLTLGAMAGDEPAHRSFLFDAIDAFKDWLWHWVVEPNLADDDLRLFFTMFDTGTTILEGIIEDGLIERGFETINHEDLREWLRRHGARELTLEQGPFVRALYDMAFAYLDGDVEKPDMAAGTAVHDLLRIFFTYRGSFAWKMQAGMGDTVFTPFYEVLKKREVHFEFFNWVSDLGLSEDGRFVDAIDVIPQVRIKGEEEYDPLVDVHGLACWPSEPRWDQIVEGEDLHRHGVNLEWEPNPLKQEPRRLVRGEDFDLAVLGISVAALPDICQELIKDERNPGFAAMVENSRTVMTQAFQLWLNEPLDKLGWPFGGDSIMTAYVEPLDTYADMDHLIKRESWPTEEKVEHLAYFCGVIEDVRGDTQKIANDRAKASAIDYVANDAKRIWPGSVDRAGKRFDWDLLVGAGRGPARFDSQFWLANWQPTERYVLTPSGSVKFRLAADASGYENLFLAGDWVKTAVDAGCVEAAVMAGMHASRAICGSPERIFGEDQGWLAGSAAHRAPRAPTGLPSYVDYGGLATCPSPVDCDDSRLYSFFLEGDHERLAALCNKVFANPTGGRLDVRPLGHHVMLSFGAVEKIKPQLEPWCHMGFAREEQVAFWVPVVAVRRDGIIPTAVSLGWFVPYMFVDNPLSLAGGREIYGFNKNLGQIELATGDSGGPLTLKAYGGDFGGDSPAGWHPLMEVTPRTAGPLQRGESRWDDLDGLVDAVRGELRGNQSELPGLEDLALPDSLFADILGRGGPPQMFLKQFRSVAGGRLASQQQITDAGVTLKRISGWDLLGEFEFKRHHLDSHPITDELGVEDQVTSLGFEIEMDFVLRDGQVLWQGPAG